MDKIKITDLEIFAHHGVLKEERENGQKFFLSVVAHTDFRRAAAFDDLDQTIDYGGMCGEITAFLTENTYKLIETAAERLAKHLLKKYRYLLRKIEVEIKKPEAPIELPFGNVSVAIERGWHTAYISAGSNMGDRQGYLDNAAEIFVFADDCILSKVSKTIETKPYGEVKNQDDFLNCVFEIKTLLSPEELLTRLNEIEEMAGRMREIPKGPRTLDLDIVYYDDLVLDTKNLTIPHHDLANREFVLAPLAETAPAVRHPITGKTAGEMLRELGK